MSSGTPVIVTTTTGLAAASVTALISACWPLGIETDAASLPAPGNIYATPLRFKLSGHPVLSARFNVETAGSERKRAEI
eukprot:COSAG06_NODE_4898_length_3874_cov_26.346755_4_plen_79_part_00